MESVNFPLVSRTCSFCPVAVENMLILPACEPETTFCEHGLYVLH